jgi:hypothetical protein
VTDWERTDANIQAAAEALDMGTCPLREGVIEVFSHQTGLELGILINNGHAAKEERWIAETPTGGQYHDSWEKALADLERNKRKVFLTVELEYAEPIDRPLDKNDMGMWDAAARFLVHDLAARRESLEPTGMRLKWIRVEGTEREV